MVVPEYYPDKRDGHCHGIEKFIPKDTRAPDTSIHGYKLNFRQG